jgi:hypothetical protein
MTDEAPIVQNAETVNVDQPRDGIPHIKVVVGVTFFVLSAFAAVSVYVLAKSDDGTIVGAVIGTWTALATSAGGFWLGASSGGKLRK